MIVYRFANKNDADKINDVIRRAFKVYADELNPDSHVKALEEPSETVLYDIENNSVFVAEEDGKILGSVRIKGIGGNLAYLYRFGVDPGIRNTGVGSGLLQTAIDECVKKGFAAIALHTNSKYYKLARYYYGKKFYVHSTSTEKGYIRALFIKELSGEPFDVTPAYAE